MRALLAVTIFVLVIAQTFSLDWGLGPLSAKNILLYLLFAMLAARAVVTRHLPIDHPRMQLYFMLLVAYAVASWVVVAFIIEVPKYKPIYSALVLKNTLLDQYIFFLVFFYGASKAGDAWAVLKALLLAVFLANAVTVLDTFHIVPFGVIQEGEDGRVQGAMGEQNQYAAFVSLFIWAFAAEALATKGILRAFWGTAAVISLIAILTTISRGAIVGLLIAAVWGTYIFRKRFSFGHIVRGALAAIAVLMLVVVAVSAEYGAYIQQRIIDMFTQNAGDASSGRTILWRQALHYLMQEPSKMITGFGWDMWIHMPFRLVSHNHYLDLWFNLGLIGVGCYVAILVYMVNQARAAADRAIGTPNEYRYMAVVYGVISLSVAIFFVNLYTPWPYIWAYLALMMRAVLEPSAESDTATTKNAARLAKPVRTQTRYGWQASSNDTGALRSREA